MSTCLVGREFVLHDRRQAQRLRDREIQRRIEALFGVQLSFPPPPLYLDRAQGQPEGEWITVRGNTNDDCLKAQNYISALCTPECSRELVGVQLAQLLFQEKPRLRDALEREFSTALQPTQEGVRVQGLSDAVAFTFSKLHKLADTVTMNASNSGHDYRQSHANTTNSSLDDFEQQLRNLSPSGVGLSPDQLKQALLLLQKRPDLVGTNPMDRQPSPTRQHLPPQQKRIEYFVKLGYPQAEVETVLESLGSDSSDNDVLARLISTKPAPPPVIHVPASLPPRPSASEEGSTTQTNREGLRPVVIDGSNVAMRHGNGTVFSCKGIRIAVNWFRQRGHTEITVFVPAWRKEPSRPETPIIDQDILLQLEKDNLLKFTPSRRIGGRKIVCYDDRFIVQLAHERSGVIVSTDNFRDLMEEDSSWKETIEKRLIMFTFVDDTFMVPKDPLGKHGPHLDDLLRFEGGRGPVNESHHDLSVPRDKVPCPYKERCTFGPKCRYYHPEREKRVREESHPAPERTLHSPNPPTTDPRSKDVSGYLDGGENVTYQDENNDLELTAAMSHLNFHSSPSKALFPNSTQPIYRRSSTDPHFDFPGGLGIRYTGPQQQHRPPHLHSPLNISAPVLMQEPNRPSMESLSYPLAYPTSQHSESQQPLRVGEECRPPSGTLDRGGSGSSEIHSEQQHMVGHDRFYPSASSAPFYYPPQHQFPRHHQSPYPGQRSSSWHELTPSSCAHPTPSISPVGHYHSSVELTPPTVVPHLPQAVSGMDGASHLLYSSQKTAMPHASYARGYPGTTLGYYHKERNLDMRQSFMLDSHRELIFQKAVELYPDRRDQIRAILMQRPGLSDLESLLRLL